MKLHYRFKKNPDYLTFDLDSIQWIPCYPKIWKKEEYIKDPKEACQLTPIRAKGYHHTTNQWLFKIYGALLKYMTSFT